MKQLLAISIVLGICTAIPIMAQAPADSAKAPKQVVEEFLAMETQGGRLTAEGWAKADGFFVHPVPMPHEKRVVVVSKDYSVYEVSVKEDRAEVYNDFEDLGSIDSALRYTAPPSGFLETTTVYHLVTLDRSNSSAGKAKSSEWKITEPASTLWLNVETAIRYVAARRDKTTNPAINADRTLAILRRHH